MYVHGDVIFVRSWWMNHVAICLDGAIYEAFPPRVRRVWFQDFCPNPKNVTILRNPMLSADELEMMYFEAEDWVGTRYNWLANYIFRGPKVHCSEYVARIQMRAGVCSYGGKEPSRITPGDVRLISRLSGWDELLTYEQFAYTLALGDHGRIPREGPARRVESVENYTNPPRR